MKLDRTYTFIVALVTTMTLKEAHAYVDPGTGSYLTQILIASVLTIPLLLSGLLTKIKSRVKGVLDRLTKKHNV